MKFFKTSIQKTNKTQKSKILFKLWQISMVNECGNIWKNDFISFAEFKLLVI